jgi:hypothetical protein
MIRAPYRNVLAPEYSDYIRDLEINAKNYFKFLHTHQSIYIWSNLK